MREKYARLEGSDLKSSHCMTDLIDAHHNTVYSEEFI